MRRVRGRGRHRRRRRRRFGVRITRRLRRGGVGGEPGRTEQRAHRPPRTQSADVTRGRRARGTRERGGGDERRRVAVRRHARHGDGSRRPHRDGGVVATLVGERRGAFETRRRNASTRVRRDASTRAQRSQGALRPHGGRRGRRGSSRGGGTSRARRVRARASPPRREPVRRVRVGRRGVFRARRAPRSNRRAHARRDERRRRGDVQFRHERRQRARRRDSSRKIRIASNVSFRHRWTERRDSRRRDSTRASIRVFPQTAPFTGRVATRARRRRGRVRRTFGRRASLVRERSHRDGNGVVPRGGGRFGVRGDVARRRDGRSGTVRRRRGDDVRGAARVDWIFQGGGEDADSDSTRSR